MTPEYNHPAVVQLMAAENEIERLRGELAKWRNLVAELTSNEDCWFDHDGYCQAHYRQPPCPHGVALRLTGGEK